eukprot:scaffold58376_cov27-Prasinocladus_malaysianus.AAC.1
MHHHAQRIQQHALAKGRIVQNHPEQAQLQEQAKTFQRMHNIAPDSTQLAGDYLVWMHDSVSRT